MLIDENLQIQPSSHEGHDGLPSYFRWFDNNAHKHLIQSIKHKLQQFLQYRHRENLARLDKASSCTAVLFVRKINKNDNHLTGCLVTSDNWSRTAYLLINTLYKVVLIDCVDCFHLSIAMWAWQHCWATFCISVDHVYLYQNRNVPPNVYNSHFITTHQKTGLIESLDWWSLSGQASRS